MPVEIVKGDLFMTKISPLVYGHGVNCHGAMGKGIAVSFKKLFPDMYKVYKEKCNRGEIIPGMAWHWTEIEPGLEYTKNGLLIERVMLAHVYNLAIKTHWRLPATYNALESSLKNMTEDMEEKNLERVAMPWVGCDLGGLNKNHVKNIMEKVVKNSNITFVVYEI